MLMEILMQLAMLVTPVHLMLSAIDSNGRQEMNLATAFCHACVETQ